MNKAGSGMNSVMCEAGKQSGRDSIFETSNGPKKSVPFEPEAPKWKFSKNQCRNNLFLDSLSTYSNKSASLTVQKELHNRRLRHIFTQSIPSAGTDVLSNAEVFECFQEDEEGPTVNNLPQCERDDQTESSCQVLWEKKVRSHVDSSKLFGETSYQILCCIENDNSFQSDKDDSSSYQTSTHLQKGVFCCIEETTQNSCLDIPYGVSNASMPSIRAPIERLNGNEDHVEARKSTSYISGLLPIYSASEKSIFHVLPGEIFKTASFHSNELSRDGSSLTILHQRNFIPSLPILPSSRQFREFAKFAPTFKLTEEYIEDSLIKKSHSLLDYNQQILKSVSPMKDHCYNTCTLMAEPASEALFKNVNHSLDRFLKKRGSGGDHRCNKCHKPLYRNIFTSRTNLAFLENDKDQSEAGKCYRAHENCPFNCSMKVETGEKQVQTTDFPFKEETTLHVPPTRKCNSSENSHVKTSTSLTMITYNTKFLMKSNSFRSKETHKKFLKLKSSIESQESGTATTSTSTQTTASSVVITTPYKFQPQKTEMNNFHLKRDSVTTDSSYLPKDPTKSVVQVPQVQKRIFHPKPMSIIKGSLFSPPTANQERTIQMSPVRDTTPTITSITVNSACHTVTVDQQRSTPFHRTPTEISPQTPITIKPHYQKLFENNKNIKIKFENGRYVVYKEINPKSNSKTIWSLLTSQASRLLRMVSSGSSVFPRNLFKKNN